MPASAYQRSYAHFCRPDFTHRDFWLGEADFRVISGMPAVYWPI